MFYLNISDIAIINVESVDYCCIIHDISKTEPFIKKFCMWWSWVHLKVNTKRVSWKFDQSKKLETRNIFINQKSYKDLVIYFARYHRDKSVTVLNLYYDELIGKIEEKEYGWWLYTK